MKLAVPITAPGEAGILYEAGATEFYCGVQPAIWRDAYGNHDSISRRQGAANLSTLNELRALAAEASRLRAPLFLTVNGNYTQEQLGAVLELASAFEEMGGAGVMIADVSLLVLLKKRNGRLVRGLSLLAAVSSGSALDFYLDLGVTRVVFPRFLQPGQIARIMEGRSGIQAECIVWLDKCVCIDGYCRFLHTVGYRDHPDQESPAAAEIQAYDTCYRQPACFELFGAPPRLPACAGCALRKLADAGVSVFKLGGRGRSLETRLAGVRFLTRAYASGSPEQIKEMYAAQFGSACCREICYYPGEAI